MAIGLPELMILHLRACLSPKYGAEDDGTNLPGARVFAAFDLEEIMDGAPRPQELPTWYVVPRGSIIVDPVDESANDSTVRQMETIILGLELNADEDEWGDAPVLEIAEAKTDILKCLHGWSPQVTAKCLGLELDVCRRKLSFGGDIPFDIDPNRYIHQFLFVVDSFLDAGNHGFGTFNACELEDLLRIFADYNLDTAIAADNPVLKSENNFPPP